MKRTILTLMLGSGFLLSAMFACEDPNFRYNESWDTDADGALEVSDFYSQIDADEFYTLCDLDADTLLSASEFSDGVEEYGLFREWDIDNDRYLNRAEFSMAFAAPECFDRWDGDGDGRLDRNELYNGVLDELDDDRSGTLAVHEFLEGGSRF